METDIVLTPSFVLTTDHPQSRYGIPVLLHRQDGTAYGPADILQPYPSRGMAPAAHFVVEMVRVKDLDPEARTAVANFLRQWPDGPQLA